MDINPETGESTAGRSPRFSMWVALLVFSVITMASAVQVKKEIPDPTAAAKWAVTSSIISFVIAGAVVPAHLFPVASTFIVGTRLEGVITIILCAFWAATVAIVTNASNGLGLEGTTDLVTENAVQSANLYYFSWAGFITSVVLLVNYLRHAFGVDVVGEVRNRGARLTGWAGLLATSLIVMGSSARTFNNFCQPEIESAEFCKRSKFGIAAGCLTVVSALVVVGMKMLTTSAPLTAELGTAGFTAGLNAFAVAFITAAKGPGATIGNLYYSIWATFLIAAYVFADTFGQFQGGGAVGNSNGTSNGDSPGDIEVEDLGNDDNI